MCVRVRWRTERGFRLRIASAGRSTVIVFVGSAKHRKTHLFRRLLAKQYRSVMPTIRIGAPKAS